MRAITPDASPFQDQSADLLLVASVTRTCEIPGITQAGIPGKIALTPTLDAEFISTGQVFSLDEMAETASGIPTPGLLTRAVHTLSPFSAIRILDLGMVLRPKSCDVISFDVDPSPSLTEPTAFDAQAVFEKGRAFGREYRPKGDYVIIAESTPGGTTTAQAAIAALRYKTEGLFASSFKNAPVAIKKQSIDAALGRLTGSMSIFERLGHTADNTLMFVAGFLLEASLRYRVVLGGGTQMAAALLIADKIAARDRIFHDPRKIALLTTRWIAQDGASDITALTDQLDMAPKLYYADFLYEDATISILRAYDEGEAKEGVGAGAAIAYAYAHGITQRQITSRVETLMSEQA